MDGIKYGCRYERGLDIVEIAKRVKSKLAIQYPSVKFTAKTERYSMGHSISISIDFGAKNPFFVVAMESLYNGQKLPLYLKPECAQVKRDAEMALFEYNFDGSDSQTDYYNVNFSASVDIKNQGAYYEEIKAKPVNEAGKYNINACDMMGGFFDEEAEEINRKLRGLPSDAGLNEVVNKKFLDTRTGAIVTQFNIMDIAHMQEIKGGA